MPRAPRLVSVVFLLLTLALPGLSAHAQRNRVVTCSSENNRLQYCPVGPNTGIRLARQRSGSPCVRGRTWGRRGNRIWVDRGCRADFEIRSARRGYPQPR